MRIVAALLILTGCLFAEDRPCLLVRPTEGFEYMGKRWGSKYEYVDSFKMTQPKMSYKKSDLEKLQGQGVHVVLVPRDAVRDQISQARDSCEISTAKVK